MLSTIYEALQWAQQSHLIFTTLKLSVFSLIDGEIKSERFSNVPKIHSSEMAEPAHLAPKRTLPPPQPPHTQLQHMAAMGWVA